jgi:tetratricopeptide (TPR) repeat protein
LRLKQEIMRFYKLLLLYRLQLGALLILGAIALGFYQDWFSFVVVLILAFIAIGSHFFFGPLRLVQDAMEKGDMELAKKYLNMIKYPKLLFKPVRQGYYMIQSNIAMMDKDFTKAEGFLQDSLRSKSSMIGQEYEGASYLQLGMLAAQKGDVKGAKTNLKLAIQKGLPDNDSKATAFMQLASLELTSKQFKIGKDYFRKAKAAKPQSKEIKERLAEMEKYVARIPG